MAITVGCDPEFLVMDDNGSTRHFDINHTDTHGNIGADHGGSCGELRPTPGTPAQVTAHIRSQLLHIKSRVDGKVICGGGRRSSDIGSSNRYDSWSHRNQSIGGHIHFGGIKLALEYRSPTRTCGVGAHGRGRYTYAPTTDDNKLVCALDFYIGKRLQKVPGGKRPKGSGYGRPSDIETKTHGFEYRTPPSWITDPFLTEATLATAQRVVEMWRVKPTCFDHLWATDAAKKRIARRRDYDFLIPSDGAQKRYYEEQIKRFKKVVFSKTYKMDDPKCLEYWHNPEIIRPFYDGTRVRRGTVSTTTVQISTTINLQICQIKWIDRTEDFEEERVEGVCRFAVPEVRVYPFEEYTPWHFQLVRDIRLRPDTIYFSKELRPFLKIKRGEFRCRFVDISRRVASSSDLRAGSRQSVDGTATLTNCVFFNASRSKPAIKTRIVEIFNECVRKKLRNSDAENASDNDDGESDD